MSDDLFTHPNTTPDNAGTQAEHFLRGEVLRLVFSSEDGTYRVARIRDEHKQEQTLVGSLGEIMEGQDIEAWGHWEKHKDHGRQMRITRVRALLPTSETGIRRYLASGLIPGIGEAYANRIVDRFGTRTLDILDNYSSRLSEVPGIGTKRIAQIRDSWQSYSQQRDIFVYLQGLGLGPTWCAKVFKHYGARSGEIVKQNPYRLAADIKGIGFLTADKIAANMGIVKDNPLRLAAGTVFVLDHLAEAGHVCFPQDKLLAEAARILQVEEEPAKAGLTKAIRDGAAILEPRFPDADSGAPVVYNRDLHRAECELAASLTALLHPGQERSRIKLPAFSGPQYERLNSAQRQAVTAAFTSRLSIITGGPGVGKTTVVGQIVQYARAMNLTVLLAAPTGRAAKRLAESCHRDAKTIHRLLKWEPVNRTFEHNADKPLKTDFLVVDEVSMLDVQLARDLFLAVTPAMHIILVGDRDQLPSVGPGAILHDLIASRRIPVTHLTEIYRQSENSRIVTNAHAVNRGIMPDLRPLAPEVKGDFYWIEQEDPDRATDTIARMISERIPKTFGFDPMSDVQVLVPMNKGSCGAGALNDLLQRTLNPAGGEEVRFGERLFRLGDRVMQIANNYDKGVYNGEMGRISRVDTAAKTFTISFDVGDIAYEWFECDQLRLAYAVTIHKSQGSEFPVVIMPLLSQHFVMLQRNLVYTGMTRARKLLIIIGSRKALAMAIRNDKPALRCTRLTERLALPVGKSS